MLFVDVFLATKWAPCYCDTSVPLGDWHDLFATTIALYRGVGADVHRCSEHPVPIFKPFEQPLLRGQMFKHSFALFW